MFTPKCNHPGCHWTGTPKQTKMLAEQAVRMHTGRVHSRTIRLPKHRPPAPALEAQTLPEAPRRKRRYTRHHHPVAPVAPAVATAPAPTNGVAVKVNFCNNCGASIEGQAEASVLAGLIRTNPKFRAKVEKLLTKYA